MSNTTKAKLSAAVAAKKGKVGKAGPSAAAAPANKPWLKNCPATIIAVPKIKATYEALRAAPEKGVTLAVIAGKVDISVNELRRVIDSVRSRGFFVKRTAPLTFRLDGLKPTK